MKYEWNQFKDSRPFKNSCCGLWASSSSAAEKFHSIDSINSISFSLSSCLWFQQLAEERESACHKSINLSFYSLIQSFFLFLLSSLSGAMAGPPAHNPHNSKKRKKEDKLLSLRSLPRQSNNLSFDAGPNPQQRESWLLAKNNALIKRIKVNKIKELFEKRRNWRREGLVFSLGWLPWASGPPITHPNQFQPFPHAPSFISWIGVS